MCSNSISFFLSARKYFDVSSQLLSIARPDRKSIRKKLPQNVLSSLLPSDWHCNFKLAINYQITDFYNFSRKVFDLSVASRSNKSRTEREILLSNSSMEQEIYLRKNTSIDTQITQNIGLNKKCPQITIKFAWMRERCWCFLCCVADQFQFKFIETFLLLFVSSMCVWMWFRTEGGLKEVCEAESGQVGVSWLKTAFIARSPSTRIHSAQLVPIWI